MINITRSEKQQVGECESGRACCADMYICDLLYMCVVVYMCICVCMCKRDMTVMSVGCTYLGGCQAE